MKIRIKFAKRGNMKFIGHLDMMRYFQKAMRRADVDIAYSEGFSPHQIMSFAAPLGVGLTSEGEYLDIEVHSTGSSYEMITRMNQVMAEGIEVLNYVALEEHAKNAMSSVAAADYLINYRSGYRPEAFYPDETMKQKFEEFIALPSIPIIKTTKKSKKEVDIRPMIYDAAIHEGVVFLKVAAGSERNLKPELVMEAFHNRNGLTLGNFDLEICRLETYGTRSQKESVESDSTQKPEHLIPLDSFGREIC